MPWGIAAAAVIGGIAQGVSSSNAADAQTQAADQANATQLEMYNQTRKDLLPYSKGGRSDFLAYNRLINSPAYINGPQLTESALRATPGYQFTENQGLKSVQNSAAARGLGVSGAALKGAAAYSTGLANNTYQQNFQDMVTNQTNAANRLLSGASLGENAAAQTGNYATQTGANIGNNLIGAGNAIAGANIATGNAIAGGANSIGNLYLTNALLKSGGGSGLFGSSGGTTGGGYDYATMGA
jgi:hypothetical protein